MACKGLHEADALGRRWGKRCLNVSLLTGMFAGMSSLEATDASGGGKVAETCGVTTSHFKDKE